MIDLFMKKIANIYPCFIIPLLYHFGQKNAQNKTLLHCAFFFIKVAISSFVYF